MTDLKNYLDIVKHYENCFDKHGDSYKGVDWPKQEDVNIRYRVMLDLIRYDDNKPNNRPTLLDFGCGLAHFYDFILAQHENVVYTGLDISKKFITHCQKKYPNNKFYCTDILKNSSAIPTFDYIIMNGVFTEKRELPESQMISYFTEMIKIIFSKCNNGLAFNVMSKLVSWERDDLFHLSFDLLGNILNKYLDRNFLIRHDYGLYEYTVYVYKRPNISSAII